MSEKETIPVVFDQTESFTKLKSCLKSESVISKKPSKDAKRKDTNQENLTIDNKPEFGSNDSVLPPSLRSERRQSESLNIRFSQMVNLREYDGELAPETVRKTNHRPIYRVLNFRTDELDFVVDKISGDLDGE